MGRDVERALRERERERKVADDEEIPLEEREEGVGCLYLSL